MSGSAKICALLHCNSLILIHNGQSWHHLRWSYCKHPIVAWRLRLAIPAMTSQELPGRIVQNEGWKKTGNRCIRNHLAKWFIIFHQPTVDFPEIFGVPFPLLFTTTIWGGGVKPVVWGRKLIWPETILNPTNHKSFGNPKPHRTSEKWNSHRDINPVILKKANPFFSPAKNYTPED